MTRHFCDICNRELTEQSKPKHIISFKYVDNDKTGLFAEFCDRCAEDLGDKLIDMLEHNGKHL